MSFLCTLLYEDKRQDETPLHLWNESNCTTHLWDRTQMRASRTENTLRITRNKTTCSIRRTHCALHVKNNLKKPENTLCITRHKRAAASSERHFIAVVVGRHLQNANCRSIHQPLFPLWHSKCSSIDPSHDNMLTPMMYCL